MEHFIKFESRELGQELLDLAAAYKVNPSLNAEKGKGKRVGCIFLNPSLRTRVSTQIAAQQLGMEAIVTLPGGHDAGGGVAQALCDLRFGKTPEVLLHRRLMRHAPHFGVAPHGVERTA